MESPLTCDIIFYEAINDNKHKLEINKVVFVVNSFKFINIIYQNILK
jgi:hypothetical protein